MTKPKEILLLPESSDESFDNTCATILNGQLKDDGSATNFFENRDNDDDNLTNISKVNHFDLCSNCELNELNSQVKIQQDKRNPYYEFRNNYEKLKYKLSSNKENKTRDIEAIIRSSCDNVKNESNSNSSTGLSDNKSDDTNYKNEGEIEKENNISVSKNKQIFEVIYAEIKITEIKNNNTSSTDANNSTSSNSKVSTREDCPNNISYIASKDQIGNTAFNRYRFLYELLVRKNLNNELIRKELIIGFEKIFLSNRDLIKKMDEHENVEVENIELKRYYDSITRKQSFSNNKLYILILGKINGFLCLIFENLINEKYFKDKDIENFVNICYKDGNINENELMIPEFNEIFNIELSISSKLKKYYFQIIVNSKTEEELKKMFDGNIKYHIRIENNQYDEPYLIKDKFFNIIKFKNSNFQLKDDLEEMYKNEIQIESKKKENRLKYVHVLNPLDNEDEYKVKVSKDKNKEAISEYLRDKWIKILESLMYFILL